MPNAGIPLETVEGARAGLQGFKPSRADNRFWELSGHVRCRCGCKLVSRVTRRSGKAYNYHVCSRYQRNGHGDCEDGKWLNADKLEMLVYERLRDIQPQDVEAQIQDLINNSRGPERDISGFNTQLEDIELRRTKFQEMFVAGAIKIERLQEESAALDAREAKIREQLQNLNATGERVERLQWLKLRMAENPVLAFLAETPEMRRDYYRDLELEVTCAGEDIEITGVFGSVTPTSTSATRR